MGIAVAILMVCGMTAKADTSVIANGVGGWTKLTTLPANLSDYYFVFVDKDRDLMLSYGEGNNQSTDAAFKTMVYRTSKDPAMNPGFLWTLEANNGGYSIKSAVEDTYYIQTEWNASWYCRSHDNGGGSASWYKWNIALTDGAYTLENGTYTGNYIGPWNDAAFSNGQEVAGNKTGDNIGKFYIYSILKSDVDWKGNASEETPANYTFKIANSYAAFNGTIGWTGTGTYTRNGNNGFDGVAGFFEFCNWEANSWSGSLSQTISGLPSGRYRVRAAGQLHNSDTQMSLDVNGTSVNFPANDTSNGTILASGEETTAGNGVAGWQYASVEVAISSGSNLVITLSSSATAQYRWANFDNVELYYLGPATSKEDLLLLLEDLVANCAPYNDVVDGSSYTTNYNIYKNYNESNTVQELQTAVDYIANNFPTYQWTYASMTHPVDVTTGIIGNADCTANDAWAGSGRTMGTGTYYDGTSRTYFTQNHESSAARSQTVTIPEVGAYLLRTIVRPVAAASYATISIGSESTTTRGIQTGSANIGNGWAYNDILFTTTSANESKTISISLSNVNVGREADCGEMHLYYIGQNIDFVKEGIHSYIGAYASAPAITLTDEVPVADISKATYTSGTSAVTFTNPNGLVFANAGQTSADHNVIVNNVCASLQLTSGHPFVNPNEFTATNAQYNLANAYLAGGEYATLVIPFNATTLPGTAYALNQGVDVMGGTMRGTEVSSITANQPVLVTASGNYRGSGVTVPVVASGATYTNGELVGVYQSTQAPEGSYVLQNHTSGEGVAFYIVGSTKPTVNPFRAYIKSQTAGARALFFLMEEEITGINTISNEESVTGEAEAYDLQGRRTKDLKRGMYIINGKKIIVK